MPTKILTKAPPHVLRRLLHQKREFQDVFIVSCARTPLGSMGGKLKVDIELGTLIFLKT